MTIKDSGALVCLSEKGLLYGSALDNYPVLSSRGGAGVHVISDDTDHPKRVVVGKEEDDIYFFTKKGKVYKQNIAGFHFSDEKGSAPKNLNDYFSISEGDSVEAMLVVTSDMYKDDDLHVFCVSNIGKGKRVKLSDIEKVRSVGKTIFSFSSDQEFLKNVNLSKSDSHQFVSSNHKVTVFVSNEVPESSSPTKGVWVINTNKVTSSTTDYSNSGTHLLSISKKGRGKKTDLKVYPVSKRGRKTGIVAQKIRIDEDELSNVVAVKDDDHVIFVSKENRLTRIHAASIPDSGRAAGGVHVMMLSDEKDDEIVDVARIIVS